MKRDLNTELCIAAAKGEADTVERLIAHGADVNNVGERTIPIISDETPIWSAVSGAGRVISPLYQEFWETVSEINPEIPKRNIMEQRSNYMRIVHLLLEAGADISKLSHGSTPSRNAVFGNDVELVRILLSYGADPNSECISPLSRLSKREGRGRRIPGYFNTVLHEAVGNNNLEIVKTLLTAGADPMRVDHEGKTSLQIAEEKAFTAIVLVLKASTGQDQDARSDVSLKQSDP